MSATGIGLLAATGALAFVLAAIGTRIALGWLTVRAVVDHPNARSSHRVPVPRGGGLGFVPAIAILWCALILSGAPVPSWPAIAGLAVLAILGFLDDCRGLRRRIRLPVQVLAVGLAVASLPVQAAVFQGWLPLWADRLLAGFLLLWFVNLFNFMDGIDGLAGSEAASVGAGLVVVALLWPAAQDLAMPAIVVAAAAGGFLLFNWHPARLFMGDAGSLALGLSLGYLLLLLAAAGALAPALILPMYFVADASLTIAGRLARGARIIDPHREHAYQRAVDGGASHAAVAARVVVLNLALAALALAALLYPWTAFLAACAVTVLFTRWLAR